MNHWVVRQNNDECPITNILKVIYNTLYKNLETQKL